MQSSIVHKLLTLLTVVSEAQKPLTFSEIVTRTGLNKSTIHRLLAIGVEEGVLRHDPQRKVYVLGARVFDLVRNAYNGYDIQEIALDEMIGLQRQFDANVTIGVPGGREVMYLRMLESAQAMGGVQRPGMREPMHCSASGKALLAFLPPAILDDTLNNYSFERFTDRTITDPSAFKDELRWVRAHGFGRNDREEYEHFIGIAAPVFNYLGEPIAVLNIWTTYPRNTMDDLMGWSGALLQSAQRVTGMIGGIAPHAIPGDTEQTEEA
ncbi:IclR family transcriptional regulator [Cognatishimia sp. F0-27]|uniref:IclR family transcriptional regulator n=1 Tax=Cognatishimia sp. F0-27 TaxID=2816855 RepID=UPI001D0C4B48|nr:IclR family transcriptional regulator [Cognatishimia sp. F0-27]MCC1491718.1 IclR family transcriptional regulator [Cognatishimia sp. F0-27]